MIEAAHPLPLRKGETCPPVIVKFRYRAFRNDVFFKKRALKGNVHGTLIKEHLTPTTQALYERAISYCGYRHTWTKNGIVRVCVNNRTITIQDDGKLDVLIDKFNLTKLPPRPRRPESNNSNTSGSSRSSQSSM